MSTKVVIKDVIGSYVYLREARENQNGEKDYSMQIILPKNHPQVEQIKKAITEVAKEHFGEKIKLSMLKIPLRDGDTEKDTPEYQNCYFFNAKAKKQPQIVNKYNEFASEKDLMHKLNLESSQKSQHRAVILVALTTANLRMMVKI